MAAEARAIVKLGLMLNPKKANGIAVLRELCAALERHGISWLLDRQTAALCDMPNGLDDAELALEVDAAAVLGGDGTMLHAVSRLGNFQKPVAGINIGTLGFLTTCTETELDQFAHALATNSFRTSKRSLLEARVLRTNRPQATLERFIALNEVTLARGETGRMVTLRALINGELLNCYRADGLIVATPTGSTAYSLSAGGPLVAPQAEVMIITPICPHSLGQRALVVADHVEIELAAEWTEEIPLLFTADGRDITRIDPTDRIVISKSSSSFYLLRLEGRSFYQALRQKLGWKGL